MNDSDKVILVILGQSIQSEEAGNEFYDEFAKTAKDPVAKELFERLAEEEQNHEKEMRAKYDEVAARCGWEPYEGASTFKFLDHLEVDLPFLQEDSVSFEDVNDYSGKDALSLAIQVEKASADYFMKAAIAMDESEAKEFFLELANSEVNHARILERELARLLERK